MVQLLALVVSALIATYSVPYAGANGDPSRSTSALSLSQPRIALNFHREDLPAPVRKILNQQFRGWKFVEVSEEVLQFLRQEMNGASPVVVKGDFDGNHQIDYAVLIRHGDLWYEGKVIGPRHLLVVFLRRVTGYKLHVIKEPNGQYIALAKRGTHDYNYNTDKEITYLNDSIMTVIPEKGGSSYVYWKGRFYSFISSD